MKDIRISIRLSKTEHEKFKILAIKRKKSMQKIILEYITKEIEKEESKSNET